MFHWELRKKFDHMNKWYMHDKESVLENETHKVLWDLGIQTNTLISASRPDLVIVNKKKNWADHGVKLKDRKKRDKYLDLIVIVIGALCTVTKGLVKVLEDLEIRERAETI